MTVHSWTRTLQGASLMVGAALTGASTFFWNAEGRVGVTGGVLMVLSAVVMLYGQLGLWELVARRRPRLGAVGVPLAILGALGGASFGYQGFYEGVIGLSKEQSLSALDEHSVAAQILLWLPGPLFPASLVVLGVALAVARVAPRPVAALVAGAGLIFPVSRIPRIELLGHAADVVLLAAFVALGVVLIKNALTARTAEG